MNTLSIDNLSVSMGRQLIVQPISFKLYGGQTLALLGRNGAGKSTLLKGIAGLNSAQGTIRLNDTDFCRLNAKARSQMVGYVAQDFTATSVRLTVFELLLLAQNSHNMAFKSDPHSLQQAHQILQDLGIGQLAHRFPAQMSGGQRQIVALALALIRHPKILLLDEPTSALDLANQLHLLGTVCGYTRQQNIATIMVLHDLNLAQRYADHTLLLENGRKVAMGPTADVLTEDQIARTYGIRCELFTGRDGSRCVHPLSVL